MVLWLVQALKRYEQSKLCHRLPDTLYVRRLYTDEDCEVSAFKIAVSSSLPYLPYVTRYNSVNGQRRFVNVVFAAAALTVDFVTLAVLVTRAQLDEADQGTNRGVQQHLTTTFVQRDATRMVFREIGSWLPGSSHSMANIRYRASRIIWHPWGFAKVSYKPNVILTGDF